MTSQLVIFRAFFYIFFSPDFFFNLKKSRKSTNKKILALACMCIIRTVEDRVDPD